MGKETLLQGFLLEYSHFLQEDTTTLVYIRIINYLILRPSKFLWRMLESVGNFGLYLEDLVIPMVPQASF
jgi:hypothetical protein